MIFDMDAFNAVIERKSPPSQAQISAIPTVYQGVRFRSRTEARWAAFFDAIKLQWQYEPEGFERDGMRYLPDFWLPKIHNRGTDRGGCYFEVKPAVPTQLELAKARMIAHGARKFVVLAEAGPVPMADEYLHEIVRLVGLDWDDAGLRFGACNACDAVNIDFYASNEPSCSCGFGSFFADHPMVMQARRDFPNFARWEG